MFQKFDCSRSQHYDSFRETQIVHYRHRNNVGPRALRRGKLDGNGQGCLACSLVMHPKCTYLSIELQIPEHGSTNTILGIVSNVNVVSFLLASMLTLIWIKDTSHTDWIVEVESLVDGINSTNGNRQADYRCLVLAHGPHGVVTKLFKMPPAQWLLPSPPM